MLKYIATAVVSGLAVFAAASVIQEQEPQQQGGMQLPQPQEEHQWLQKLTGEWTSTMSINPGPGQEEMTFEGTETTRSIGEFWIVAENKSSMMGQEFTGLFTLGYDPEKEKYIGTWIDSMTSHLWTYEGAVDEAGKKLTLETEGPSPTGGTTKFRETIELKSPDHKVFTSSFQLEDGSWAEMVTVDYRRKK